MVQKLILLNEVIKVKGRVKVITVKKDKFDKILKLTKLRVLDKEYEALMPPLDGLQKNTIDFNGLASLVQQYLTMVIFSTGSTGAVTGAEIVLTTQSGTVTLTYTGSISLNSQGVTVYMQVLQEGGNYTFQYFYVGFDTTNNTYTTSQLELYVSGVVCNLSTETVRIAYTNASFTKTSDSYLFIVWLLEFQNIPPYLVYFTPTLHNNPGISACNNINGSSATVYFNNGSCTFRCGGNCPSAGLRGFITYIQNNSVVLEFPITAPLNTGVSSLEVMLCTTTVFANLPTISGNVSSTVAPPVSGATFYVAIATITITYQGS